jgi:hypothetical protein
LGSPRLGRKSLAFDGPRCPRRVWKAYKSIQDLGPSIDLSTLPAVGLEATSPSQRDAVASLIGAVAGWPGFATSVATKVLHKKRPALIPVLDNQAIFGAHMNPRWPAVRSHGYSVWAIPAIRDALERVTYDLTRPENAAAWVGLRSVQPERSAIVIRPGISGDSGPWNQAAVGTSGRRA